MQCFRIRGDDGSWQVRQGVQYDLAPTQVAQREFSDNKRGRENHSGMLRDRNGVPTPAAVAPAVVTPTAFKSGAFKSGVGKREARDCSHCWVHVTGMAPFRRAL